MESLKNWWKFSMSAGVIKLILGLTAFLLITMTCMYVVYQWGEFLFGAK